MTESSVNLRAVPNLTPLPKKLFSDTEKPKVPPSVPAPAPIVISPVGFSSTLTLIIFVPSVEPLITSDFTDLNKFEAFKLFNDLAFNNSLKGSPSSISSLFLITLSKVILFPNTFILSM